MNKLWFRNKTYGYGWFPATWEGWLVIAGWALACVVAFLLIDQNSHSAGDTLITFIPTGILLTLLLIAICYKKGEKPGWHWGNTDTTHE